MDQMAYFIFPKDVFKKEMNVRLRKSSTDFVNLSCLYKNSKFNTGIQLMYIWPFPIQF